MKFKFTLLLLIVFSAIGCGKMMTDATPEDMEEKVEAPPEPVIPRVEIRGQVSHSELSSIVKNEKYSRVISLRFPNEPGAGWEEGYMLDKDILFERLPVSGKSISPSHARELAELVRATPEGKVLVYCKSGKRAGSLAALVAYFIDGNSLSEAMRIGKNNGMAPPLTSKVKQYLLDDVAAQKPAFIKP